MNDQLPDPRLISGAVISAEMWFAVEPLVWTRTFGRRSAPAPGALWLPYRVTPKRDVTLEGPVKALSEVSGELHLSSQRDLTGLLGRLRREEMGYNISIDLYDVELDRFLMLMASGLRPHALKIEFDIEVAQWVDIDDYWDDVRYPIVDVHEYYIDWAP